MLNLTLSSLSALLVAAAVLPAPLLANDVEGATVVELGALRAPATSGYVVTSEVPRRSVGLWWAGDARGIQVELLAEDGAILGIHPLTEQHDLAPDVVGTDRPAGDRAVSGLLHAYDAPLAAIRLISPAPIRLDRAAIVWIDAPDIGPEPKIPVGGVAKPFVYDRASWGASAPTCTYSYCNVTHLAVHHSASTADYNASTWSQAAANVKGIQTYHQVTNGWCDIGYQYLVSKQGWIFEGRGGGDDVVGAHDGKNCGSMAACMMGYFHPPFSNAPTTALLDATADLFAWKAAQKNINPLGSAWYAGFGGTMNTIYGHRDVSATACPGDSMYAQLPGLRNDVNAIVNGGGGGPGPGGTGTLKGVLYQAALGTSARISGGTVALSDGRFVVTGTDGYYEFSAPAGTVAVGATAPGYEVKWSSDNVPNGGETWESLGLSSKSAPTFVVEPTGPTSFNGWFSTFPGDFLYLAYSLTPGYPVAFHSSGGIWPDLGSASILALGTVPGSGTVGYGFTTPSLPGLSLHMQALAVFSFGAEVSNGGAFDL